METSNTSAATAITSKAWLLFGLSTVGMLFFAGLYFFNPKTSATVQTNTVTNTITNQIIKEVTVEVPKEVEKIIKVPAEIPEEYVNAMNLFQKMTNASFIPLDQVLFNMNDVKTEYSLSDVVKQVITEDEVKAKFELTLRRNNVPINPKSANTVRISIDGFFDDTSHATLCYAIQCNFDELQWIFRGVECHRAGVRVWTKGDTFGTVGKQKANEGLLPEVEKCAEIFANDFLSANSKPK